MTDVTELKLDVGGMSCAACAMKVEQSINKLPGVQAEVNFATERARVWLDDEALGASTLTNNDEVSPLDPATIIAQVEKIGYTAQVPISVEKSQQARSERFEKTIRSYVIRLWVVGALTIPVMLISMIPTLQFDYWQWLVMAMVIPVATWGAWPFHKEAGMRIRYGSVTMETLVSLGVITSFGWSLYAIFFTHSGDPHMRMSFELFTTPGGGGHELYFEVTAAVAFFLLLGKYLEIRTKNETGKAVRELFNLGAKVARFVDASGSVREVPADSLAPGDLVEVLPGDKIPSDGEVIDGVSAVDASMITGESLPIDIEPGTEVTGGTINLNARIRVRITKVGSETVLARMADLVDSAQSGKTNVQRIADQIASIFVPIVIGLAVLAFILWWSLSGSLLSAITAGIATLIIACPCALGLATPTALLAGTGRGSQLGILISNQTALESAREIDTVVLDKTGTVTKGVMSVVAVQPAEGISEAELLAIAAAVESGAVHPIAKAIVDALTELDSTATIPESSDHATAAGQGAFAMTGNKIAYVGKVSWISEQIGSDVPEKLFTALAEKYDGPATVVTVLHGLKVLGLIAATDVIKPDSAEAIAQMHPLGLETILLTGDNEVAASAVASQVGIDQVFAEVLPKDKLVKISQLQASGKRVAMVGDGVNDSPALVQADLGIAMGHGTEQAIAASDITVVSGELKSVVTAIKLARKTLGTIRGNLFWAFAYNAAAIPLAMLGMLNPSIAALAMAFSSVFVVTNSLRLTRFKD
ncbi:MAG: copper-translocating P-type ATPase [Microbacteriaceae bacterium]|nr:copper-translocating P-type ATPase [Microbacteriaceae bacterium]